MDRRWLHGFRCRHDLFRHEEARRDGQFHDHREQRFGHRSDGAALRHLEVAKRTSSSRLGGRIAAGLAGLALAATSPTYAYDWLQFNGDAAHSGNNTGEHIIGPGNVASLTQKFQVALPGASDGAPVFLESVPTPSGTRDLLYIASMDGWIVALDAATGATMWSHQYGPNGCVSSNGGTCYTTSSPAVDPNRQYVYAYGLDGKVHKYRAGDGTEIKTGGWPQPTTLKGQNEKASSALAIAAANGTSYLYVAHGGYPGDGGDYQGHVTAIDLATGLQNVFNAACSDQTKHLQLNDPGCSTTRNAVWARPGVIYDAATNRLFLGTGNGHYDAATLGRNWSESVLAINPDATGASGKPLDSFTPASFQSLDNADADLGSTAPAILPVPAGSLVQRLAVQGGKDNKLRLINLSNLSGQSAPGHTGGEVQAAFNVPQGGNVLAQPAVWVSPVDGSTWVFVTTGGGISGLKLALDASGNPSLVAQWQNGPGGTSPIVANNVLFYAGGGSVRALDPTTGAVLWTGAGVGTIHWQSPMVANGTLYVAGSSGNLTAFSVAAAAPTFVSPSSAEFEVGVPGSFTVRATGAPAPTLSESGPLPGGITFNTATGVLAGTATEAGSFALQFAATNGVPPDAVQSFTLDITTPPPPSSFTIVDPGCSSFAMTGVPPNQTLVCADANGTPVCAPAASPPDPVVKQPVTVSANCSGQPTAFIWSGGGCDGVTGPTCTTTKRRRATVTISVEATNASGTGPPASITVHWQ
ncbi:MAG TPA: PQQ-binding-like beta-propeller repeat protein [Gemmatimonadales bacterium]